MSSQNSNVGRRFNLPRSRRLTTDVLRYNARVPICPHDRIFSLGELRDIRRHLTTRVSWSLMFIKAFAHVAESCPQLRQLYFGWPWPNVYQHPDTVAMMAIHRDFDGDPWLFWGRFVKPEAMTLTQLQRRLDQYQTESVKRVFRQQWQLSALPTPIRRVLWWWNLNVSGPGRARRTGTSFLSTLAGLGAEIQCPPAFLTSNLTYGPMDAGGRCRVTIGYDHRLMDGRLIASALGDLEQTLNREIADELKTLAASDSKPDSHPCAA